MRRFNAERAAQTHSRPKECETVYRLMCSYVNACVCVCVPYRFDSSSFHLANTNILMCRCHHFRYSYCFIPSLFRSVLFLSPLFSIICFIIFGIQQTSRHNNMLSGQMIQMSSVWLFLLTLSLSLICNFCDVILYLIWFGSHSIMDFAFSLMQPSANCLTGSHQHLVIIHFSPGLKSNLFPTKWTHVLFSLAFVLFGSIFR